MTPQDLSALGAGFSQEALGSQAVFRAVLQALSHPGRPVDAVHDAEVPAVGHPAAAVMLLALLDADCTLWLSPRLADSPAAAWLRFHTGCQCVTDLADARFAWVAEGDALPALAALDAGTDTYPDQSATCIVEVRGFGAGDDATPLRMAGPGIRDEEILAVRGLPGGFVEQWADNGACFPRGVDVLLASPSQWVGLPRTTRVHVHGEG